MKFILPIFFSILTLLSCSTSKTPTYQGAPLITADNKVIDYRVNKNWYRGYWSVVPDVPHDTLQVTCYNDITSFQFVTDQDSISFDIRPDEIKDFYVLLKEKGYAHTVVQGVPFARHEISFEQESKSDKIKIEYQRRKSPYLSRLSDQYPIDLDDELSELEKVAQVLHWTHDQWEHDGTNSPKKSDAISILEEVKTGVGFPCFAYGIVLRDQLNAIGISARTIYLKSGDAETADYPPGHVATEAYIADLGKWVFLDGQFDIMPRLHGTPLNAVEFQRAITNDYQNLELVSVGTGVDKDYYTDFIYQYLFHFDTAFDHRYDSDFSHEVDGKTDLMLVPKGAPNLTRIEFWDMDLESYLYTNSIRDFYAAP